MLAIRLTRTGKIHAPHYRIVVQEKRSKLNGKSVDVIGHYHPAQTGKQLVVDKEKAQKWLAEGAQPSDTVTNLLVKEGILPKERTVHTFFTPGKKEAPKEKTEPEKTEPADAAVETESEATAESPTAEETEENQSEPAE
ncbi:30S ribosomal protein S16 [Patescibacteria group bacterium]|nr:30S ribosomal protein S16 [Patescibacteria group bacterium]